MVVTEPATPLVFHAQPGGTLFYVRLYMNPYPKKILSIPQQLQAYMDAGMAVPSVEEATKVLETVGYYRLRGYCFHLYDNTTKKYRPNTNFSDIVKLYQFDCKLSHLLFNMTSEIEISLRSRLSNALLTHHDALILLDSSIFSDKKLFWKNLSSISSEIARSNDVFIQYHFEKYDGKIPVWAAVEIMSFGTLSKTIKNLKTGIHSAYNILANYYCYQTKQHNAVKPSLKMLSSWIQAVTILRNMCAHNSRIYNRTINTFPEILLADRSPSASKRNGLYQILLAMKYLRPSDESWNAFYSGLQKLFSEYQGYFDINCLNFPSDWTEHLSI